MLDLNKLKTNLQKEVEGVEQPFGDGAFVTIARIGNSEYKKLLRNKYKASRAILEQEDDLATELGEQVMVEVYARTIVKGWRGISFDGQTETPYSIANAEEALKYKDFQSKIQKYAEEMSHYQDKAEAKIVTD